MIFPYGLKKIEDLYNNSELGSSGFYPIGTGNLWHSGVHLNLIGNNSDVYSLLPNGKVIAYRLDDKYEDCDLPDKITVDQFNHEFNTSNYHKKYKEVKDGESIMYYTLDESLKDKTYSISHNFILLKHELNIDALTIPLVFYSLYMNLSPVENESSNSNNVCHNKTNQYYPDFMCEDTVNKVLKRGFVLVPKTETKELLKIGRPGFIKGERYVDFCVFFETSFFNISKKNNFTDRKAFHHFLKNIKVWKIKGTLSDSENTIHKYKLSNQSKFEILDDSSKNAVLIKVTGIRITFKESSKVDVIDGKYKVNNASQFMVGGTACSDTNITFICDDHLKDNADYKTSSGMLKACYLESDIDFNEIKGWLKRDTSNVDFNNKIFKQSNIEYTFYEKNPDTYIFTESIMTDNERNKVLGFCNDEYLSTDNKKYFKIIDKELFITEDDMKLCLKSVFDWDQWFYEISESVSEQNDIVCDRTNVTDTAVEAHNEAVNNEELLMESITEKWYGDTIKNEYLNRIFGSEEEKYQFALSLRKQFRRAVCVHPLEWDKSLYDCTKIEDSYKKIADCVLREHTKKHLIAESKANDLWEGCLSEVFKNKKNSFFFVNPIYFIEHMHKAGLFEFNPYEGKTYKEIYRGTPNEVFDRTKPDGNKETNKISLPTDWSVVDNPGFTTVPSVADKRLENGYGKISGLFNEDYLNVIRRTTKTESGTKYYHPYSEWRNYYYHFGVDFCGKLGDPIVSLIYGKVIAKCWISSDGRCLLIQGTISKNIYMLCHLSEYAEGIDIGKDITPGMIVAKVGGSGNSSDNEYSETAFSNGNEHLHVSVVKKDKLGCERDDVLTFDKKIQITGCIKKEEHWIWKLKPVYIDPFNYSYEGGWYDDKKRICNHDQK